MRTDAVRFIPVAKDQFQPGRIWIDEDQDTGASEYDERKGELEAIRAEQRAILAQCLRGPLHWCITETLRLHRERLLRQMATDLRMDPNEWRYTQGRLAEVEALMRDPLAYLVPAKSARSGAGNRVRGREEEDE